MLRTQSSNTVARCLCSMCTSLSPWIRVYCRSRPIACYLFKIEYFPHLSLMMSKNCTFFFLQFSFRFRTVDADDIVVHNLLRHHISRSSTKDMSNRFTFARRVKIPTFRILKMSWHGWHGNGVAQPSNMFRRDIRC